MYTISGTYNTTPIKKRTFNSYDSAVKYLDSLITSLDVQIEEILSDEESEKIAVGTGNVDIEI